jgi:hypothetical protein
LAVMVLGWSPFNIVSDSPAFHSRWLLLLKIEISSIPPKDHHSQICFNLVQRFQRRRFKCDLFKICLICIIVINRLKEKFHWKTQNIC